MRTILGGVTAEKSAGGGTVGVPQGTLHSSARRGLTALSGFAGIGVGLSALYVTTGVGLPCPLRAVTGWDCPLCGGTRLGGALLHLDLAAAFAANPVVFVGLGVLTLLGIAWIVELLGGPAVRVPAALQSLSKRLGTSGWTVVIVGSAVLWTLVRNLF